MKAVIVLFLAIFFGFTIGERNVNGQTVTIGHATAEVVESVSATSTVITDFELSSEEQEWTAGFSSEILDLGAITVFSGRDVTCDVVLKSADLNDSLGNEFTIEPALTIQPIDTAFHANGSQTFQLGGTTKLADRQASGMYEGSFTVIFAYN